MTKTDDRVSSDKTSGIAKSSDKAADTDGDGDKSTGVTGSDSDIKMSVISPIFILFGRKTVST